MAGAGWRTFTREVLEPEHVQDYLMDQAILAFDSASQRSTELAVPEAGMVSFLRDTGRWEGRTRSAAGEDTGGVWRGFGHHWGSYVGALPAANPNPNTAQPGDTC